MDYFFARSAGKQTRSSVESGLDLSLTINSASRRALLPPRISFIILSAITPFASNANNIKELIIYCPLHSKEKDREWFLGCDIVPRI
jgi:hypothetical protein